MKSDNNKRMMLVIIFIIIFLVVLLVLLYYYTKIGETNTNGINNENIVTNLVEQGYIEEEQAILYTDNTIQQISSTSVLLAIQDCINTYYGYNYSENYKAVYELLDDNYVEANNITENNVFNKINKLSQKTDFFVIQAYQKEISFDQEYEYYVYGNDYLNNYDSLGSSMFIINLDFVNMTFKIIPYGTVSEDKFIATMQQ
ncbi:MAG: hypothetical protein Q4D76_19080, partial [Oscillospiraceae bacterium]|nr:hypothetical protein [Oscillospiraceae bacterium]